MIRSYRAKLLVAFLAIVALLLSLLGGLGYLNFKDYYLANLEARLTKEAYLVSDLTQYRSSGGSASRTYQDICITAARDSDTRVTIIDSTGTVIGDSEVDPATLDNHSTRPEVFTALHGQIGADIRYSDTLNMNMLYVAVPFSNEELSGAVRMAMPLAELQGIYNNALMGILLAALLCGLAAVLASIILAQFLSRPLRGITAAVQELAAGNLKRRIYVHTTDEMGILAQSFNDMGQHIEQSIQEVSEVKNRLEAILDNTVNGVVLISHDHRVDYANPIAKSLLGLAENSIGRKYVEVITTYEVLRIIDEARNTGKQVKRTLVLHNLGAKMIEANAVPINNADRTKWDILLVMNDVTEIKRLEQVRKDFVANVSHELKTPVASISGFAETLLAEGGKDPDNVVEFAQIIYDEAQRLAMLIKDLLELSKLESENYKLSLQEVDVAKLVEGVVERVAKPAGLRDINIKYTQAEKIPLITSDPELIDLIVVNLLDNAVNYSRDGGQIEVRVEDLGDKIKIKIKDYGIGIPAADIDRIFERFYRVDKARSRKTGGTGLGLSIVKHSLENLRGQVQVESFEGQGSTFNVFLPK